MEYSNLHCNGSVANSAVEGTQGTTTDNISHSTSSVALYHLHSSPFICPAVSASQHNHVNISFTTCLQ